MGKKTKLTLLVLFLILIFIECGMRLTIWNSLKRLAPNDTRYVLSLPVLVHPINNSCSIITTDNYKTFIYTTWLIYILRKKVMCEYQSPHMQLTVVYEKRIAYYHWSFEQWRFIDNDLEQREKKNVKSVQ